MVPIKAKDIQEASGARLLSGDPESLVSSISGILDVYMREIYSFP